MITKNNSLIHFNRRFLPFFALLFLSLSSQHLFAQLYLNIENTNLNGAVKVDFKVDDFVDIASFQFTVEWDKDKLRLDRFVNSGLVDLRTGNTRLDQGLLPVLWFDPLATGKTLADGSILFSLYFEGQNIGDATVTVNEAIDPKPEIVQIQIGEPATIPLIINGTQVVLAGTFLGGQVYVDENDDCTLQSGEMGLGDWIIEIEGMNDTTYVSTNSDGTYGVFLDAGTYTVNAIPTVDYWEACEQNSSITLADNDNVVKNFGANSLVDCPSMTVDISNNRLRRCFGGNTYYVDYCNLGTQLAQDAYVEISLDSFLTIIDASLPYTIQNDLLVFDLGDVGIGECGRFSINVSVDCDSTVLGQTHCTTAHIYPDSICSSGQPLIYDGPSLRVSGYCDPDSETVNFFIENVGNSAMSEPLDYVIIEDVIMYMSKPIQLNSKEVFGPIQIPAGGATYRIQVPQVNGHPGRDEPTLAIEGCGTTSDGTFTLGAVNLFPQNDANPFIAIDCTENRGSFDPNDKQGFPLGVEEANFIEPNMDLEYLIRFQNTGTDTAFRVVIVDTLSADLNITSIRPGASSHPYEFELLAENIARFTFDNIHLPDSNVNEPASNGFVRFNIRQLTDLPNGTEITNSAAIYFDFNDPIITNQTLHTINDNILLLSGQEIFRPGVAIKIFPNPSTSSATFELSGADFKTLTFRLHDSTGRLMRQESHQAPKFQFHRKALSDGLYFYTIEADGALLSSGKVVLL